MPIPGAGVSATNLATKKQVNTSTDVDGSYSLSLPIPAEGRYTVKVQMAAFAASSHEVALDATHQDVQANFELALLSRAREEGGGDRDQRRANAGGRGFQSLSVFQGDTGQDSASGSSGTSMADIAPSGMPVPGIAPGVAQNGEVDSVAVAADLALRGVVAAGSEAAGPWFLDGEGLTSIARMGRSITELGIRL